LIWPSFIKDNPRLKMEVGVKLSNVLVELDRNAALKSERSV
jgi:hypothetical protein